MKAIIISFSVFILCSVTKCWSQSYSDLDTRIQAHYSQIDYNQLVANSPQKLDKIIFLYTSSFHIVNPNCESCATVLASSIDITEYEHFRLQSTRMKVGLNRNGDQIELLSQDELNAQYQLIDNNH